jgi:MarR family transcriptional regulator, 2-MHQ and catechol-resistance regulon repressor
VGTHYTGNGDIRRALNAYIKLSRATKALWSQLGKLLNEYDLTLSQLGTLEALYHLGPMCQKDLGDKLLVTGGNITMVVTNLEKRRLIRRQRLAQDRRQIVVSLTDEGEALIGGLFPKHAQEITDLMGVLSPEEQDHLAEMCKMLGLQTRDD